MVPVLLAKVKRSGKLYVVESVDRLKVRCHGDVLALSGLSANYGPPKVFRKEDVEVREVDRTDLLMAELLSQAKT